MLIDSVDFTGSSETINNLNVKNLVVRNEKNWSNKNFESLTAIDCEFAAPMQFPNSKSQESFGQPTARMFGLPTQSNTTLFGSQPIQMKTS